MLRLLIRALFAPPRRPAPQSRGLERLPNPNIDAPQRPNVRPTPPPSREVSERPITGKAWVIDGDTIVVNRTRVRLAGIDAPELEHPYGKMSKYALVALCNQKRVTVHPTGAFSHDRIVGRCELDDGRDLSAEMVRAGMALDWKMFSGGRYRALEPNGVRRRLWRAARRRGM